MKICIDAGHYGRYNQSPADRRYYESELTWRLHLLQKRYLEEYGIEVIVTREDQQKDLGLYSRGAASRGCTLFISDHTNAVGTVVNDAVDYPAAYCAIDGRADGIGMALAQCVERVMGTGQQARIEHRRGQHGDYYGVLRGATAVGTPGLILENSFHTNARIAGWLLEEENVDRLARAQAETIALYYNIIKPLPEKKSGWVEEDGGMRFYLGNTGEPVRNDWYQDGEDWYWFDGAGMMIQNDWKTGSDGRWYFLGSSGAMVKDQWVVWKGELYRMTGDGSIYQGSVCLQSDEKGALLIQDVAPKVSEKKNGTKTVQEANNRKKKRKEATPKAGDQKKDLPGKISEAGEEGQKMMTVKTVLRKQKKKKDPESKKA